MSVTFPINRMRLALCAAAAAGFALAIPGAPVQAQNAYDEYGGSGDISVYAPRHQERDPATGAPYEWVQTSRVVHIGDLDLHSRWGVRELRARIWQAASEACDELDSMNDLAAPDNPPCVETAVRRAMYEAPIPDYLRYTD